MKFTIPAIVVFCLFCTGISVAAPFTGKEYRIGLIHSYNERYAGAEKIRKLLEKGLKDEGVRFSVREYFLDCEIYVAVEEERRIASMLDSLSLWKADLIVVLDDQAAFSLMACRHPFGRQCPVVFSGVNYPNAEWLKQYPNVTGIADAPDYLATCRMVEGIVGKAHLWVLNERSYLDKQVWSDLTSQLRNTDIKFNRWAEEPVMDSLGKPMKNRIVYQTVSSRIPRQVRLERYAECDSTSITRLSCEDISSRDLLWIVSGIYKNSLFLYTKRDFTTLRTGNLSDFPAFSTINEGFGMNKGILGGYFVPTESFMKATASQAAARLKGEEVPQVTYGKKEFVLDWGEMKKYRIEKSAVPSGYVIMYMPFYEKYKTSIILVGILLFLIIISVIAYLLYIYFRELRYKFILLDKLKYEQTSLSLAIQGSKTYAWKYENGIFYVLNDTFWKVTGLAPRDFVKEEIAGFIHPDDVMNFNRNVSGFFQQNKRTARYRCRFGSGNRYEWWEFRYSSLENTREEDCLVAGLLRNIQDEVDKERELLDARALAEKAKLEQAFLANMSHEIRTPLNAIVGLSNILASDTEIEPSEKEIFIQTINSNCDLLLKLINDILDLSRIESGNTPFKIEKCSVRGLLEEVYHTHTVLMPEHLEFIRSFPGDDAFIEADHLKLTQVLTNLLNNAVKFTRKGSITLGYETGENQVRIFVKDTGRGIPAASRQAVFDRFYKQDEFTQGTGLGLSICASIMEKLRGKILLESQEGEGTVFTLVFGLSEKNG